MERRKVKLVTEWNNLKGKTITSVYYAPWEVKGNRIYLAFSDGTAAIIEDASDSLDQHIYIELSDNEYIEISNSQKQEWFNAMKRSK